MKIIAIAQLNDNEDRHRLYRLKYRIFLSDDSFTQNIMGVECHSIDSELSQKNKREHYSFFHEIKDNK